ncbi:Wzz/FepE/Etk N-terminal domain-containing protein [Bosea sp. 117]|uniref:GumC family protein n=1 Tax=Bosea sp. 117 TaxID=1125973 RepID=UPI0018CBFFF0|nr:Wzz/FepE/Etk N-terminal domain-containing protein [Bosea sp. 117]
MRALGRHLWRRRFRIIIPTIVVGLLAAVAVNFIAPYYSSEARVLIESGQTVFNRPASDSLGQGSDVVNPEAILSQVQVISSRDLAREVIQELKLDQLPEFAQKPGRLIRVLNWLGINVGPSVQTQEERVLAAFQKNLHAYHVDLSRVIVIEFTSTNAELAARIANAVADAYLRLQQVSRAAATRQSTQWLSNEIASLRPRVAEAEAKVEAFRSQANLYVGAGGVTLSAQQLGELTTQLTTARAQKGDAESRAAAIRSMLRSGGSIESTDMLNSGLIRALVERRILLQAALAEQSATLLPRHPRIRELRAQLADLEQQIRREAEAVVRSFENDARIAGVRAEQIANQLDQLKKQASVAGEQDVQLRALEREARAQRELLESYLGRYRDAASREDPASVQPDARIISRAAPALEPTFPKKVPIILIVTLGTFLLIASLSVGSAIFGAPAPTGPSTPSPVPGPADNGRPQHLPWIGGRSSDDNLGDKAMANGSSAPESTLADLTRLIQLREAEARLVVVTGMEGDDGASRCALALARSLAASGRRSALVCLDTDAAALHQLTPDPRAPGLTDLLFGVATFSEAIHRETGSRCHVIPPGRGGSNPDGLASADRLILILSALAQTYDHVVVAAQPLGHVEGAERIAALKPTVILVTPPGGAATDAVETFDGLARRGFSDIAMVTFAESTETTAAEAA